MLFTLLAHGQGRHAPTGGSSKIKPPTLHYLHTVSPTMVLFSNMQVTKLFSSIQLTPPCCIACYIQLTPPCCIACYIQLTTPCWCLPKGQHFRREPSWEGCSRTLLLLFKLHAISCNIETHLFLDGIAQTFLDFNHKALSNKKVTSSESLFGYLVCWVKTKLPFSST